MNDKTVLSEQQVTTIAESLPGGVTGYMKTWGYLDLSRAIERAILERIQPAASEAGAVPVALFGEAIAWGRFWGPEIPFTQWDKMRDEQAANFARRLAAPIAAGAVPAGWLVAGGSFYLDRVPAQAHADNCNYEIEPLYRGAPPAPVEAGADHNRLVRELDVLLNGEDGAAPQARLCDIVAQVRDKRWKLVAAPPAPIQQSEPKFPVPWPKGEDITQDMRDGFERLHADAKRCDGSILDRNDQGAYKALKVDADWKFYQRAWADALQATAAPIQKRGPVKLHDHGAVLGRPYPCWPEEAVTANEVAQSDEWLSRAHSLASALGEHPVGSTARARARGALDEHLRRADASLHYEFPVAQGEERAALQEALKWIEDAAKDARNGVLVDREMAIIRSALAAESAETPEVVRLRQRQAEAVMPSMRAAFRTTDVHGNPDPKQRRFEMVFKFRSVEDLHKADDEWRAYLAAPTVPHSLTVAQGDERDEWKAFGEWAWKKEGEAIGRMHGRDAGWEAWQARADLAAKPGQQGGGDAKDKPSLLGELTDDLIEILGRPNFTCIRIAQLFRLSGQTIPQKSEAEQAAVIYFLLRAYLRHGKEWSTHAEAELKVMAEAARAQRANGNA